VLTYAGVERLLSADGRVQGVELRDELSPAAGEAIRVLAPVVINVAGPWVDQVLAKDGDSEPAPLIGGTKGSHLITGAFPGGPSEAMYVAARSDGRPFFIIPWNDQYLIGTTDLRYTGNLDRVVITAAEIDYLLAETNRVIPGAGLDRAAIHYTYAGVRPLPHVPKGAAGAITRRHLLHDHAEAGTQGLMSVVGGKLTTYRELADLAVDWVQRQLGEAVTPSRTGREPLPGALALDPDPGARRRRLLATTGLTARSAEHLADVYGGRAGEVVALATSDDLLQPFDDWSGAIGAEVLFAFANEAAATLTDVLMRRTMVGLGPDLGLGASHRAAAIAAAHLGWDAARVDQELAAYRAFVQRFCLPGGDDGAVKAATG
jgi:glycerol-3-phosphate dehydrogenase